MPAATRPPASVVAATLRATGGPSQLAQVEQRVLGRSSRQPLVADRLAADLARLVGAVVEAGHRSFDTREVGFDPARTASSARISSALTPRRLPAGSCAGKFTQLEHRPHPRRGTVVLGYSGSNSRAGGGRQERRKGADDDRGPVASRTAVGRASPPRSPVPDATAASSAEGSSRTWSTASSRRSASSPSVTGWCVVQVGSRPRADRSASTPHARVGRSPCHCGSRRRRGCRQLRVAARAPRRVAPALIRRGRAPRRTDLASPSTSARPSGRGTRCPACPPRSRWGFVKLWAAPP